MRHAHALETLLKLCGRRGLYALSVVALGAIGWRALAAGAAGVRFAPWAVAAILIVLLLAGLEQGGWFKRVNRPPRRARPGSAKRPRRPHACRS